MLELWPPNFSAENERRELTQRIIASSPEPRTTARDLYADDPVRFIQDCTVTYDPRNVARKLPTHMPFILFNKQIDFVRWLVKRIEQENGGLVEKSRDMGATWLCAAFSVWLWVYKDGSSVGWGSRKEQLVDKLGDPDSIFEKIRTIVRALPWYALPQGFNLKAHSHHMRLLNPENQSTITGEAGDNIGRGGRKLIYFKDESAHYERAELIEAALGDNTDIQIDISSVNGLGNVFHRRRHALSDDRVFILDWRDHPGKDEKWYDAKKKEMEDMGLGHIFAQEVDRDYGASVEGIFIPSAWVKASIDAHIKLDIEPVGVSQVGYDPSDEGGDLDAVVHRKGIVALDLEKWSEGDPVEGAKIASLWAIEHNADLLVYDNIGIGAGTKGKLRELRDEGHTRPVPHGWSAAGEVKNKDQEYKNSEQDEEGTGRTNADMFLNAKAQEWWLIRQRFHKTWRAITQGAVYPHDELISISSGIPYLHELCMELSQPKRQQDSVGRVKVESKKDMRKRNLLSPNLAEGFIIAYIEPSEPQRAGAIVW